PYEGACFLYLIQEGGSTKDVTLRDISFGGASNRSPNVEPPALRGRNPYAGLQDAGHAEVGTGRAGFSRPSLPIRSAFLIACAFFPISCNLFLVIPFCGEFLYSLVCYWMLYDLTKYFVWDCCNVSAIYSSINDLQGNGK